VVIGTEPEGFLVNVQEETLMKRFDAVAMG
jgi:hypothetical protein